MMAVSFPDVKANELALAVAETIAELRVSERYTLDGLADASGLHRTSIGLVERGERLLSIASASQLAHALGMPLSELVAHAERKLLTAHADSHDVSISTAMVIPRAKKRIVNPDHGSNDEILRSLTGVGVETIIAAIEQTYDTIDLIDDELLAKQSPPVSKLVELANLSSMLGNLLGTGIANASGGKFLRNRPHAFPDLVPQNTNLPELEIKTALETNSPKGHLPKPGTYLTFRYVLALRDGKFQSGKDYRGDTPWVWEVRCGALTEDDFAVSNTAGDSGKTAVIKVPAFKNMTRVFYNPDHLPYKRRNSAWGDGNTNSGP
ncbi:helix-turn-helix domain-containing protein [Dietzia maris]